MKTSKHFRRPLLGISVVSILLALTAWKPTLPQPSGTDDVTVQIGSPNTVTGSTTPLSNPSAPVNISAFRGFIGGINNVVGTSTSGHHGAISGNSNFGNAYWSFVGGTQNRFGLTGNTNTTSVRMMGLFGSYNVIGNSNTHLLVGGYANSVNATTTLVSGTSNTVAGLSGASATDSVAIGYFNQVASAKGWAIGDSTFVSADGGVAIGTGVQASQVRSTALGRYNATMAANDVLAIGSGSNGLNRFTALRVTDDGGVILGRAQGDISMGAYGN